MCTFSESSRVRLGNAVMYIAARAKYPYKTKVLKLLFLMEERMVQKYHVPMLSIPYSVWRLVPSIDDKSAAGFMHYAEGRLIKESEKFRKRYFAIKSKKKQPPTSDPFGARAQDPTANEGIKIP